MNEFNHIELAALTAKFQSGMGLPHSKTPARFLACHSVREVLECGSPMPLSCNATDAPTSFEAF